MSVDVVCDGDDVVVPHPARLHFWLAPRVRDAVRRLPVIGTVSSSLSAPCAPMPMLQCVIVAARLDAVEPTAFLQPIAPAPPLRHAETSASVAISDVTCADGKDGLCGGASVCQPLPYFFSLSVFVWPDTTLREVIETVLARSASARVALLTRRDRVAAEDTTASDAMLQQRERVVDSVCVLRVSPGDDGRPCVRTLAALRVDEAVFGRSDYVTMQQLRRAPVFLHHGDLLVLAPCNSRDEVKSMLLHA